jgi:hypothetical protein
MGRGGAMCFLFLDFQLVRSSLEERTTVVIIGAHVSIQASVSSCVWHFGV